jgi:hypothetical protein
VVFAAARRQGELAALAAAHPGIRPVTLDTTDPAAIARARHQITAQTGGYGLDVVVNAAGILVLGPVEAVSDHQTLAQRPARPAAASFTAADRGVAVKSEGWLQRHRQAGARATPPAGLPRPARARRADLGRRLTGRRGVDSYSSPVTRRGG